jgi:hypothetical protein
LLRRASAVAAWAASRAARQPAVTARRTGPSGDSFLNLRRFVGAMCKNEQACESHAVQQQLPDACGSKRDRSPDAGDAAPGAVPACETAFDPAEVLRAASAGRTDAVVSFLGLRVGEASHVRDRCASEALLHAANYGHIDTVRALASSCRADVEAVSDSGWSPVMYAARNGHSEVVVALVQEFGANPEHTTSVGRTAIMYAASHGHTDTAKALEQCGADPRRGDARGLNAIMYAKAAGYAETAQMLEASGPKDSAGAVRRPVPSEPGATEPATHTSARQSQSNEKRTFQKSAPQQVRGHRTGRRVVSSHLPRKVSTPPSIDKMPSGPCAEGGGLWTINETAEVFVDKACPDSSSGGVEE